MSLQECPLPEVAEALGPYIKPRGEVVAIRQGQQRHLQVQLCKDGPPITSVNVAQPQISELDDPPPALNGVRKAYWKALQAHNLAQAKYDALKADLEAVKHDQTGRDPVNSEFERNSFQDSYIALLHHKEKQRKLKVIDRTLSAIGSVGGEISSATLDDMIKKQVGELPLPPSAQPPSASNGRGAGTDLESKILDLKKAIISSKRQIEQNEARQRADGPDGIGEISHEADVAGLQKALQELTGWMESRLTVIAEADAHHQSNGKEPPGQDGMPGKPSRVSADGIDNLYEDYLEARRQLIQTVNSPPDHPQDAGIESVEDSGSITDGDRVRSSVTSPAEVVLPYIPGFVRAKEAEQALLQQSAYIRRHLSAAESDTDRLILRLADESHLVPPGASRGKDWTEAAAGSDASTEEYVKKRVQAGRQSAVGAKKSLDEVRKVLASLEVRTAKSSKR